jgi:hypothetical protein
MTGEPATRTTLAERRHAEIVEQLRRVNTGIEVLNQTQQQISRQIADVVARTESALQYVVRAWQATQPAKPRR